MHLHVLRASGLLVLCLVASLGFADTRKERRVGPGVTHIHEIRTSGPINLNVLKVDLQNPEITIETEKLRDRLFGGAVVTDVAKEENASRHTVVAGVNGDFWTNTPKMFYPIGFFVSDGMIYNSPYKRSVFALTESGRPFFGILTLNVQLKVGSETIELTRVNDGVSTTELVLFTPPFGENATASASGATLVAMEMQGSKFLPNRPVTARVSQVALTRQVKLGPSRLVLSIPKGKREVASMLKRGTKVEILARVAEVDEVITYSVGGGPRIVRDGEVDVEYQEETMGRDFSTVRHPRTAVGIHRDGSTLYFVTVDGRQPLVSIGQNLYELAAEMIRLGCVDAINLDGGGSTTMVVRGKVVNRPSDLKGPRTVSNSVLVISKAPTGPLTELQIQPTEKPLSVPSSTEVSFTVSGFDENYNELSLKNTVLHWATAGAIGQISGKNGTGRLQTSADAASGAVSVSASGTTISARIPVEVVSEYDLRIEPAAAVLTRGEKAPLKIMASGAKGNLLLQPGMFEITGGKGVVKATPSELLGLEKGSANLRISVGNADAVLPCFVDTYKSVVLADWDGELTSTSVSGVKYDPEKTGVRIETARKKHGSGSLAFQYALTRGGTSKVSTPVDAAVTSAPAKYGLWIFGDGKQVWLRAEVVDSADNRFMLDFTEGSKGVYWKDQWRHVLVPAASLVPRPQNPSATPRYPATIKEVYVAQDQEALKGSGTLLLDSLEAIYAP